jgi:hypothetical protein
VLARETNDLVCLSDDRAALGRPDHGNSSSAAELEQAFVAQLSQRAQNGVRVDAEDGGEVAGRGEPLAGLRFSLGNGAADLYGDLLVQIGGLFAVDLDDRGASWSSLSHGLPLRTYDALAVDPAARLLYAGALGGGIYELRLAPKV